MSTSKHILLPLLACFCVALLGGCSEEVQVHTRDMDRTYLVVEAMLTDQPDVPQKVVLTESIDYFVKNPSSDDVLAINLSSIIKE